MALDLSAQQVLPTLLVADPVQQFLAQATSAELSSTGTAFFAAGLRTRLGFAAGFSTATSGADSSATTASSAAALRGWWFALPRPPQPRAALWSFAVCAPVWVFRRALSQPQPQHPPHPQQALARPTAITRPPENASFQTILADFLSTGLAFAPPRVRRRRFGLSPSPSLSTAGRWQTPHLGSVLLAPITRQGIAAAPPHADATPPLLRSIPVFGGLNQPQLHQPDHPLDLAHQFLPSRRNPPS